MRPFLGAVGCIALLAAGCGRTPQVMDEGVSRTTEQRLEIITSYAERATREQPHRFRKPVRDRRRSAQEGLAVECELWLGELRSPASPTALTGTMPATSAADSSRLQASLEQLRAAACAADRAGIQASHARTLAAACRTE